MVSKGWGDVDEKCPTCNTIIKKAAGLNKQNIKKLFFSKPTTQDIILFCLMLSVLVLAWAYTSEVNYYHDVVDNKSYLCVIDSQEGYLKGVLLNGTIEILNEDGEVINLKYNGK